jgi:hypothetical protein
MEDKEKALKALNLVLEDLDMLEDGKWKPNSESIQATRDNVQLALSYIINKI